MASKDDQTASSGPDKTEATTEVQRLQNLYELMVREGLDNLELKDQDYRIRLSRRGPVVSSASHVPHAVPKSNVVESADSGLAGSPAAPEGQNAILTPLAGVFYRASSPTIAPYVKEGDVVEIGQTLCIVEAMKVMNEIKAESRCRITKILIENARPVTAMQALFQTEPAA